MRYLPILLASSALLASAPAQARLLLEIQPESTTLRMPVADEVYAAGSRPDFAQIQITDQSGRNLDFAICEVIRSGTRVVTAPLIAVPDIARVGLDHQNRMSLQFPPGALPPDHASRWVLDLRADKAHLLAVAELPPIQELRRSPNLQQWSAPIPFQQDASGIRFEAFGAQFLSLSLSSPVAIDTTPERLNTIRRIRQLQRSPHWYSPQSQAEQRYLNTREMPVFAARINGQPPDQVWQLESRQGDWDVWKPHGRVAAGTASQAIYFSAVTDPQWRLRGSAGRLELAHPAYELRLPSVPLDQRIQVHFRSRPDFGAALSCNQTEGLPEASGGEIFSVETAPAATPNGRADLRPRFLIALLVLLGLTYLLYRYRKHRQAR